MQKMFKKEDLKAGMVVEIKNGYKTNLAMVCPYADGLCISSENIWYPLRALNNELEYSGDIITKIYGLSRYTGNAYEISTYGRELLWERKEEPEYMTFSEAMKYKYMKHKNNTHYNLTEQNGIANDVYMHMRTLFNDFNEKVWLGKNEI